MYSLVDDPVHGIIRIPAAIKVVLNAPEVQRLRDLHQLGLASYVYPSATHTRFEHSVGCMHLALTMLDTIVQNHQTLGIELPYGGWSGAASRSISRTGTQEVLTQSSNAEQRGTEDLSEEDMEVTATDRFCVAMAGLCHDIGHGPLSHTFESLVNDEWAAQDVRDWLERRDTCGDGTEGLAPPLNEKWDHETMGLQLCDQIWQNLGNYLLEGFGLTIRDREFVKLIMVGLKDSEPFPQERVGRPAWKRFMVDIVANKSHGLDVDKLDYLQRDGFFVGNRRELYVERIFQNAFVVPVRQTDKWGAGVWPDTPEGTQYRICYSEKVLSNIETVFDHRKQLHCLVYQHRVVLMVNRMVKDALQLCGRVCFIRPGRQILEGRYEEEALGLTPPSVSQQPGIPTSPTHTNSVTPTSREAPEGGRRPRRAQQVTSELRRRLACSRPPSNCLTLQESTRDPRDFAGTGDWVFGFLRHTDSENVPLRLPTAAGPSRRCTTGGESQEAATATLEAKERARIRTAQAILDRLDARDIYLHLIHIYCETEEEVKQAASVGRRAMAYLERHHVALYRKLKHWESAHGGLEALCYESSYFSSGPKEVVAEVRDDNVDETAPVFHKLDEKGERNVEAIGTGMQKGMQYPIFVSQQPYRRAGGRTVHPADLVTLVDPREMRRRSMERHGAAGWRRGPNAPGAHAGARPTVHSPSYYHDIIFHQESSHKPAAAPPAAAGGATPKEGRVVHHHSHPPPPPQEEARREAEAAASAFCVQRETSVIVEQSAHLNNRAPVVRQDLQPYTFLYWMCRLNRPGVLARRGGQKQLRAEEDWIRHGGNPLALRRSKRCREGAYTATASPAAGPRKGGRGRETTADPNAAVSGECALFGESGTSGGRTRTTAGPAALGLSDTTSTGRDPNEERGGRENGWGEETGPDNSAVSSIGASLALASTSSYSRGAEHGQFAASSSDNEEEEEEEEDPSSLLTEAEVLELEDLLEMICEEIKQEVLALRVNPPWIAPHTTTTAHSTAVVEVTPEGDELPTDAKGGSEPPPRAEIIQQTLMEEERCAPRRIVPVGRSPSPCAQAPCPSLSPLPYAASLCSTMTPIPDAPMERSSQRHAPRSLTPTPRGRTLAVGKRHRCASLGGSQAREEGTQPADPPSASQPSRHSRRHE